jgi:hypothetical protein
VVLAAKSYSRSTRSKLVKFRKARLLALSTEVKHIDVQQGQREKLALNVFIWCCCGYAVFATAVLGNLIGPMEHVYNLNELTSHTSISGRFDLT